MFEYFREPAYAAFTTHTLHREKIMEDLWKFEQREMGFALIVSKEATIVPFASISFPLLQTSFVIIFVFVTSDYAKRGLLVVT